MAKDKKKKSASSVDPIMSAYDRLVGGRGPVDMDEIRREAEANPDDVKRADMERLGLDEPAYEKYKKIADEPAGPIGSSVTGYVQMGGRGGTSKKKALAELQEQTRLRAQASARSASEAPAQPAPAQPTQAQQTTTKLANGTQQVKKDPPLTRKGGAKPPANPEVAPHGRFNAPNGVTLNGIPVGGQSEVQSSLRATNRNNAAVLESNSNTARKDAAAAEREADAERGQRETQERLERADRNKEYWDKRLAARNEELYDKRRAGTREEWENLGRLRGDEARDGKALTDDEYNTRLKGLYDRAAALRKNQKENAYLKASDANAMQSFFKNVGKVTFDDKGNAVHANGKRFTNAQLEALESGIAKYEGAADERKAALAARTKAAEAQSLAEYRAQNGLQGFSDDEVRKFRRDKTARDVKGVLEAMASDGAPKDAAGYNNFATRWEALAKSGADFAGVHAKALKTMSPEAKAKYMSMLADAPDAETRQTLRQNIILNQLYTDNGIKNPGAVKDRRTMEGEVPGYEQTLADNLRTNEAEKLTDRSLGSTSAPAADAKPAPAADAKPAPAADDVMKPKSAPDNAPGDPGLMPELTPRADPLAALNKPDPLAAAGFKVPGKRDQNKLISDDQAIALMNSAEDKASVDKAIEIDEDALKGPKQPTPPKRPTPEDRENRFARRMAKSMGY